MAHDVTTDEAAGPLSSPSRRAVLAGAGVTALVVLTGCSTYDSREPAPAPGDSDENKGPLAKTTDVPVGEGLVTDRGVVITQPTAGQFLGFTSVCTHQGCTVSGVKNGAITCPCHGSAYKIQDGSVLNGPANRPLRKIDLRIDGTDIFTA
jgi:Rieske Fe-S protein